MAVDAIYRLAIVEAHEWKCIICRKLIAGEFDLDHLIPEEMEKPGREVELAKLCADLGRPGFNIHSLLNIGPAHKTCNNEKGSSILPEALLAIRLDIIEKKLPDVHRLAAKIRKSQDVERSLLTLVAAIAAGDTSPEAIAARLSPAASQTGSAPAPVLGFAIGWSPSAQKALRAHRSSVPKIELALTVAARSGRMDLVRELSPPNTWVLRFTVNKEPWRAYATLDDGLLLITKVEPKREA
ncbi:MAG: hypothetical protein WCF26_10305 [Candidatus Sulfotelmatobacter sp.]|jgi:hypothetical protein